MARGIPNFPKHLLPFPYDFLIHLSPTASIDTVCTTLNTELSSLPWFWIWDQSLSAGIGYAPSKVWSRQARRKAKLSGHEGSSGRLPSRPAQVLLGVRIQVTMSNNRGSTSVPTVQVKISWIQGSDSVMFESFCGMVGSKLDSIPR